LFTGARAEELAQLRLRDFEKVDIDNETIYYINIQITDPKKQSLKNLASERFIPISKYLIEWGFLNYVQERINEKADYLFDLTINKDKKRNGFQKNFNQDIKSHIKQFYADEHKGRLPSFHDLRSHFVSKFLNGKNEDINKLIELKKLIGHTNKDLHKDVTIEVYYREPMEIKYSKYLMDNIDLKIDKGYKHIKEMMNERYNDVILKDLEF
jgi:integrase